MTPTECKKQLARYRELVDKAQILEAQAREWRERVISIASKPLSDMPRNPSPKNTAEDAWLKHLEIVEKAQAQARAAAAALDYVSSAIDAVPDTDARGAMRYRYIAGLNWYDTAAEMGVSLRTATRAAGRGVKYLSDSGKMTDIDLYDRDTM